MLVEKHVFSTPQFLLQCGRTLRNVEIGFETYGSLNEAATNAILVTHYFSGTSHAAGRYDLNDPEPGYWDTIIGPGKAIDTNKWFVVSSDTLCNLNTGLTSVTTTGPTSTDPDTGRPYASNFPVVSIADFVELQKQLCDSLGIKHLHAVVGPSMGALQAMEWAARFPDHVERIIGAIGTGLSTDPFLISMLECWSAPILLDPHFNGGEYYGQIEPTDGLTQSLKLVTLNALHFDWANRLFDRRWTSNSADPGIDLKNSFAIEHALQQTARERAKISDANSFLRLCRAVQLFDIRERKHRLRAKFLLLPAESDLLMYPALAERGAEDLRKLGLSVKVATIKGDGGHLDGLNLISQTGSIIREFLEG